MPCPVRLNVPLWLLEYAPVPLPLPFGGRWRHCLVSPAAPRPRGRVRWPTDIQAPQGGRGGVRPVHRAPPDSDSDTAATAPLIVLIIGPRGGEKVAIRRGRHTKTSPSSPLGWHPLPPPPGLSSIIELCSTTTRLLLRSRLCLCANRPRGGGGLGVRDSNETPAARHGPHPLRTAWTPRGHGRRRPRAAVGAATARDDAIT